MSDTPTPSPNAINMADAWGYVVVSNFEAAAMFDRLADMVRDSSPQLAQNLQAGAEALRSA